MNSRNRFIVGIIVIVVLIAIMVFLYFRFENDTVYVSYTYTNASVYATYNKQNIETGYKVFINNSVYSSGSTLKYGSLLLKLPINQSIQISSYNLEDQNFYTSEMPITYIGDNNIYRFNIKLEKPGILDIKYNEVGDNVIRYNIDSNGEFRHLSYCVKWTLHVLTVESTKKYSLIENPMIYENYDRCYYMGQDLKDNSTILELEYKIFGQADSKDNVEVVFFDGDYQRGIYLYEKMVDEEWKDINGNNVNIIVPLKN